jgi:hypothetical protein
MNSRSHYLATTSELTVLLGVTHGLSYHGKNEVGGGGVFKRGSLGEYLDL